MNLYVWDGVKTAVPVTATYTITKTNFESSTGNDRINIGRLVNDYIDFMPVISATTETVDADNQVWCKTEIIYTTADPSDDGVVQEELTQLVLKGYGRGNEGENAQPSSDGILIEGDIHRIARSSTVSIPLLVDSAISGTVISYPDSEVNYTISESIPTESGEMVQVLNIVAPANDEYIEITIGTRVITLIIKEEYKYTPVDIYFLNKDGGQQSITFFKERKDSMTVTRENYESIQGQPSAGYHQFVDFNVNGKTTFTLTSGFIPESQNEAIRELMLSSRVYLYDSGFVPLNVVKNSIQYQTRLNERLISYDIEFGYSFSEVNNI